MLLRFGATCRSRGQRLGTLWGACFEPSEKLLLRVIVEEPQAEPLVRVKVPFSKLLAADGDQVALDISAEELRTSPAHGAPLADVDKRRARRRRGDEPIERILSARTRLHCRDGEVGTLTGLSVDARSGDLLDLSLAFGMPLTRELVIGAEHVEDLRDDQVDLGINRDDLETFPTRRGA